MFSGSCYFCVFFFWPCLRRTGRLLPSQQNFEYNDDDIGNDHGYLSIHPIRKVNIRESDSKNNRNKQEMLSDWEETLDIIGKEMLRKKDLVHLSSSWFSSTTTHACSWYFDNVPWGIVRHAKVPPTVLSRALHPLLVAAYYSNHPIHIWTEIFGGWESWAHWLRVIQSI